MPIRTFQRVARRSTAAWQLYTRARVSRADLRFDNLVARIERIKERAVQVNHTSGVLEEIRKRLARKRKALALQAAEVA
jgi:hypothetical protein